MRLIYKLSLVFALIFIVIVIVWFTIKNDKINVPICDASSEYPIEYLTSKENVLACLAIGTIPKFYVSKEQAEKTGWRQEDGNICNVLPNKAIGGNNFNNNEKLLPPGNYFEFDLNQSCQKCSRVKYRGAERLVVSKKDKTQQYYTNDHYRTFQKILI